MSFFMAWNFGNPSRSPPVSPEVNRAGPLVRASVRSQESYTEPSVSPPNKGKRRRIPPSTKE